MGKLIDLNGLGHFKDKENEMIAADYSATKTYAVGDYVYYNGVLKRCITAITTAEAYTAAHWTNAVLAGDVTELKTAFTQQTDEIVELYGINLFNSDQLLKANGWTESNGEYSGTMGNMLTAFSVYTEGLTVDGGYKENTQYSIRLKVKSGNTPVASGNTIQIRIQYTDSTDAGIVYVAANLTSWTSKTVVTTVNKTVSKIYFSWSNTNAANNMFYITDFQIAEGDKQPTYEPYIHTAIDKVARADCNSLETNLFGALKNTEKVMDVKWKRGTVNANGNISSGSTTDENNAATILPCTVTRLKFADEAKALITCFDDNGYLGKINSLDKLDTTSGNYKVFSGEVNMSELFTKYSATYVGITVKKSGSSCTTDAEAIAFGKANCTVYTQENADYDFVPPYFNTELTAAIENAKSDMGACGKDGFSFIFTTDNHWNHNDGHSPALIKAIQKATNIQDVVLGGDMIDGGTDKAHELELLQSATNKFVSPDYRLHYIFGNHDSNTVGQTTTPALHLSNGEVFMATQHPQKYTSVYSDDGYVDYYWDDDTTKTRVIVVDSKIEGVALTSAQLTWFNATLASTPSGYRIIVMMHIWYGVSAIATQGEAICDAVDAWNAEHDTKVVAMFGGHTHVDAEHETDGGVPLIITTCDLPPSTTFENVSGQAVDVITVNYTAKKINCRRVGRGDDREVSWT